MDGHRCPGDSYSFHTLPSQSDLQLRSGNRQITAAPASVCWCVLAGARQCGVQPIRGNVRHELLGVVCRIFCLKTKLHDQRSSPREISLNFNKHLRPFPKAPAARNEKVVDYHSRSTLRTVCLKLYQTLFPKLCLSTFGGTNATTLFYSDFLGCLTSPLSNVKLNL